MISYSIPSAAYVSLKVYDILGKEVATLFEGTRQPGSYAARFDGTGFSSGIYLYRLQSGGLVQTRKLVIVK
jgi:Secretion system C-terminal sorting domain